MSRSQQTIAVTIAPSCSLEGVSNLLSTPGAKILLKNVVFEWQQLQTEETPGAKVESDERFSLLMDACSLVVPVEPSCLDRPLKEVRKVIYLEGNQTFCTKLM